MDDLAHFPFVVARVDCTRCTRTGAYRLARLPEKYGPNAALDNVLAKLSADCVFRTAKHPYPQGCMARFRDLVPPERPPDLPKRKLRVISGGKP